MTDFDFTVVPPGTDETKDEFDFEIEQPAEQAPEFDFQVEPPTPEPTTVLGKVKKFGTKLSNALGGGLEEAFTTEVPQMVGEAMEWIGSKTTQAGGLLSVFGPDLEKAGKTVGDFFEKKAIEWYGPEGERHDIAEKGWQRDIYQGTKMLGPSLIPQITAVKGIKILRGVDSLLKASAAADKAGKAELAASLLSQANRISETALTAASAATATIFGASQGEATREQAEQVAKALEVMGLHDEAKKIRERGEGWVSLGTATVEALGEFFGTKYLGKMLRVNEAKVVEMGLGKAVIRYLKTLGVEVGTEMFQAAAEAKLEKDTGVRITAQPWEEAKSVIAPTVWMTSMTGAAGHIHNKIRGRVAMALDKEDFQEYTKLTQNPLVTEEEVDKWVAEKITDRETKARTAGDSFADLKKTTAPVDTSVKTVPSEQIGSGIAETEVAAIKQEEAKEQEVTQQAQVKAKEVEDQLARDKKAEADLEAATQAQAVVEQQRAKAQAIAAEDARFNQAISTEDGFYREAAGQIHPIELEGTKEQKNVVKHIRELHQALVTDEGRPDRFRALIYKLDAVDESLAMMGKPKVKAIADGLVHRAMERIDLLELVEKRELAIKEEDKQAAKAAAGTATMPEKALPPIPTSGKFDFSNPGHRQSLLALGYTENEIDMAKRFAYMRKPTRQTKEKPVSALRQPGEVPGAISVEKLREIKAKEAVPAPQVPQDQRSAAEAAPAIPVPAETIVDRALKTKGGDILTGKTVLGKPAALHAEIWDALTHSTRMSIDRNQDGFITSTGRFVNREQAKAENLAAAVVPAKVKPKDQAQAKKPVKVSGKAIPEHDHPKKQEQLGLFSKYERSEPVKAHVSTQDIKEGFQKIRINLAKAAPVAILNTSTDLKAMNPELHNQMETEGVHGRIKGVYDPLTNTIYVFADMHQSVIEAKVTTWHEMGHYGLQDLLGEGLNPSVDRVRSKYKKEIQEYMDKYSVPNTVGERRRAAEEVLIEKFQANKDLTIVQSVKSLIHGLANRIGFEDVVTDAEVSTLLRNVREHILAGRTESKNTYWLVGHTRGEPGDKIYQIKRGPYLSRNAARKACPQALGMIYSDAVKQGFKLVTMEKISEDDYKYQREVYPATMHPRHENILHKVREDIASGKIEEGSPEYAALLKKHGAEIRGATIQHAPGVRFLVGAATVYGPKQKGDTKTVARRQNLYGPVEITSYKDKYGRDVTVGPIFSQDPATRAKEIDEIVSRHQQDITWYEDWKNWMMGFVKAGIPETTITKCIKIQALLSAGSGPRENQRYFARVLDALESGTLRPGPLSRITEQSKTQLGLFLNKGQTKGDIQKETEVTGAGISAQVYPKIMEIWEGRDNYPTTPEKQAAYGEKVGAYLATALAPLEERTPVIDRHMPRPWGFNIMWSPKILEGGSTWKVDAETRDMITADIQASSDRTGVSVGGVQAAIWFEVRNEDLSSATYWEAAQEGMEFVPEMFQSVMTLEGQDAIHYSDRTLTAVRGSGLKESHNTYSKKDIGTRKTQTTAEWPYIPLGQFFTAAARPEDRFLGKVAHLATVKPGTIYDGGMDLLKLWTKAERVHAVNHGTNVTNIFSKLVRDLGYLGFSHNVQGQSWVAFFGDTPVVGPSKTQARLSDVVTPDHAVPQDLAQLHEIANERAGLLHDEIEASFKDRYPEIKVQRSAPTLSHFVDATQNEMEYGLSLELVGPMPSIRAALSDIVGVGKKQQTVYIQGDQETMGIAPTGVNLRFQIKQGVTTDAVAIGLKKHGVVDYNLELGPKGLMIDQYFDGKDAVPENLAKFFDEYGEPGTAEQYDAALHVLDRNTYKDHILNHFGVTEGEKIYAKSYAKGQVHQITGGRLPSGISQEAVQGRNDLPAERGEGENQPGTQGKYLRIPIKFLGGEPKVKVIPMTLDEVERVANDIQKHLARFPNLTVVNSIEDLDKDLRKRVASKDTQQYVRGFIQNKDRGEAATIWIIANKQQSEAALRKTLFHELLGHWGLQLVYPDKNELNAFLDQIVEVKPKELAYLNTNNNYNFDLTSQADSRRIAEEWFSKQISDTKVMRNIWLNEMYDRLADMFQKFARMMGIKTPITNSEIRVVMKKSADAILKNKERGLIELIGEPWTPALEAKRGTMPKYSREVVTIPGEIPTETDLLVNPTMQTMKDFILEKPTSAIAAEKKLGASPMEAFKTLGWRPLRWMLIASEDGKPNLYAWDGYVATHSTMLRVIRRNWIDVVAWAQAQGASDIEGVMTQWADQSTWRKPRQAMYSRASWRENVRREFPGLLDKINVPDIGSDKAQTLVLARRVIERSPLKNYGPYKADPETIEKAVARTLVGNTSGLDPWNQDAANQILKEYAPRTVVPEERAPFIATGFTEKDLGEEDPNATINGIIPKYMRHTVPYTSSKQYARDVKQGLVNVETPEAKAARAQWVQRRDEVIARVGKENPPPSMRMEFFQENTREEQQLKLAAWQLDLQRKTNAALKALDQEAQPKYARELLREKAAEFTTKLEGGRFLKAAYSKQWPGIDPERLQRSREAADDMYTETLVRTVKQFREDMEGKGKGKRQNWSVVKKAQVMKIWSDFADTGYVSNEKAMDKIWRQTAENAIQVVVNTDLAVRGGLFPTKTLLPIYGVDNFSSLDTGRFSGWIRQEAVEDRVYSNVSEAMRTSDFGLIMEVVEPLFYAQTAEEKLVAVDRIFNTVHARYSLTGLFVEGGWQTLEELAGREAAQNMSPGELLKQNAQVFPRQDLRDKVDTFSKAGAPAVVDEKTLEEVERERQLIEQAIKDAERGREKVDQAEMHKLFLEKDAATKAGKQLSEEAEARRQELIDRVGRRIEAQKDLPKFLYSEKEIKDHIGMTDVTPGNNNRMGLSLFQKFVTQVFDSNLPRKVLEPKGLPAAMSGYKAASMISNLPAVMHAIFHEGTPEFESNWVKVRPDKQGGLYTGYQRLGDTADNFFLWQTAKSAQELIDKGRTNIFGQEQTTGNQLDDQQMVDSINALVGPVYAANTKLWDEEETRLKEFNEAILDFAEKANIIDPEQRLVWQRQNYIPFNRVLDDDLWGTDIEQLFPRNPAAQVGTVFRLKGGKLNMGDPLMNLANTYSYLMQQSLKNLANGKTLNLALGAGLVHRIAPPPSGRVKKGEIQVRVNGEAQFYRVLDPYLYDALIDMDLLSGGTGNKYLDWLVHWPKVALTFSVTVAPAFRVANFVRDTLSTSFMENSFLGVSRAARNFVSALVRTNQFREFASTGGAFTGAYHSRDILANTSEGIEALKQDLIHGGFDARNPLDYARFVMDVWNRIGEASENANRLRVYTKAVAKGKSVFDAAYEAKDLLDFHRTGKCTMLRYFTTMVPFLNARLQGLYKMGRTSVDDKTRLNFWFHAVGLAVASLALHAHNRDDDRYKALTDADKLLYWHFFDVPGIGHLKVPNPFEVGVLFAAMPVALIETLEGTRDGADLMRFIRRAVVNVFAFDPTPQFVKPIVGQYFNQNTFTGQQIVPMGEKGIAPQEQYGPSTSLTARAIGEELGVSPRRIDQLVNDYFSYAGMTAFYFADMAVGPLKGYPEKAGERVGDMNITGYGRFVKGNDPSSYTKAQEMFYDYLDKVEEARNTWTMLRNTKQMDKAREWKEEHRELINRAGVMGAAQDQVAEINWRIKRIHANPYLTPAEKRLQLNEQAVKKNRIFEKSLEKRRERANDQTE